MADNYCKCCGDSTPEYIIELNQQGAPGKRGEKGEQGYSPIVDFIVDDNEIKFTSTNENDITSTPNLYDFVAKKDLSNITNPVAINGIFVKDNNIYTKTHTDLILGNVDSKVNSLELQYKQLKFTTSTGIINNLVGNINISSSKDINIFSTEDMNIFTNPGHTLSLANTIHITDNIPYIGTPEANSKIATIGDMPKVSDSKITIKQGNDIKGSFTLNQESNGTIELDTGITNPLEINSTDKSRRLNIGYTDDNQVYIRNYILGGGSGTYNEVALITPNITRAPMSLTAAPIDDLKGMYYITLNYDNDTLKVNGDNKLYADFTPINNSITTIEGNLAELTTLANNTEASLNELKTDYGSNKTEVAKELTTLGNQINTKQNTLVAGNNITLSTNVDNTVTISSTGGSGGGVQINDEVPSAETVYSSNKVEDLLMDYVPTSTYTEGINQLEETKNQNIFDINKFTIVGSPTITNDGIASGFTGANFLDIQNIGSLLQSATNWSIEIPVKFTNNTTRQEIFGGYTDTAPFSLIVRLWTDGKINVSVNGITNAYNFSLPSNDAVSLNTDYLIKIEVKNNYCYFYLNGILQGSARQITEKVKFSDNLRLGRTNNVSAFTGSIDLKQFSITTDGKKVFSGLMESTKPIYDKITTTNTRLSTFKVDTTNNFSAVNSALNEKANISDLANYVPLATYNELLARVETLEAEINGGNA